MSDKPEIKIETSTEGDWVEVTVGSEKVMQGHSFSVMHLEQVLKHLGYSVTKSEKSGEEF